MILWESRRFRGNKFSIFDHQILCLLKFCLQWTFSDPILCRSRNRKVSINYWHDNTKLFSSVALSTYQKATFSHKNYMIITSTNGFHSYNRKSVSLKLQCFSKKSLEDLHEVTVFCWHISLKNTVQAEHVANLNKFAKSNM